MKHKELQEYKTKPLPELYKELADMHEKMVSLKLDVATGKVKSLKDFKYTKKSIAQLETIIKGHSESAENK